MRIVRLANFITPCSGGLRTALRELGAGYAAAGHEPVLVMPGAADHDEQTPQGRVITLRGPVLPLSGGYRLPAAQRRVAARAHAEQFGWPAAVRGFLAAHAVAARVETLEEASR
ncbi:MAG TPA: hypothetical protein VLW44_10565 [Streptosporangiaceae bacterium]|nr:hypothetical protein [Streptosporangiaceae bacterium]